MSDDTKAEIVLHSESEELEPSPRERLVPIRTDGRYGSVEEEVTPEELDARIAEAERDLQETVANVMAFTERPEEQPDESTPGAALVLHGQTDAVVVRKNMAQMRAQAIKAQKLVQVKQAQLTKLMAAKQAELERVMKETLGPLQQMVSTLQEGIWTVNLYLGREEEIVTLAEGERAPADTPVTIRQMVLAMDQESAVAAEHGGIDSMSFELFDDWLVERPEHLEQVFPHQKGVVAFSPRFMEETGRKTYGNDGTDMAAMEGNSRTYFLIRNGENLWRLAAQDFRLGRHLIPRSDEFTRYFVDSKSGEQLRPGTQEWVDAEKRADAQQRHFMRVALILQGLVDRTAVFHPLPEGGLNLLSQPEYLSGKIDLVLDAEKLLGTGGESFSDWQRRLNSQLRTGMRIIGNFKSQAWLQANEEWKDTYERKRTSPQNASGPVTGEIYTLDERREGGWVFKYKRTDTIERKITVPHPKAGQTHPDTKFDEHGNIVGKHWVYRHTTTEWIREAPKTRASCLVFADDTFLIPLDLAKVEDMEYFLQSRLNRHEYVDMFPVLQAAIAAKKAEAAEEAPFRQLLIGALGQESDDYEDAEASVDDLITWWKLGTKTHRALTSDDAKAIRDIVREYNGRRKAEAADEGMIEQLRAKHPDALLVGRNKQGQYQVYEPCDDRNVFVRWWSYTATGKPHLRWGDLNYKDWHLPQPSSFNRWERVYESERWQEWNLGTQLANHLTGPEIATLLEQLQKDHPDAVRIQYNEDPNYYDGPVHVFRVTKLPERPDYPEFLLDGFIRDLSLDTKDYSWERKGREATPKLRSVWRTYLSFHDDQVLFENAKLLQRWEELRAEYAEYSSRRSAYRSRADRAASSIREAWHQQQWAVEHAKFMEDVGDEELWEDHQKSIRVSYPWNKPGYAQSGNRGWRGENGWDRAIDLLIERDHDLNGMTLQQVVEQAMELGLIQDVRVADDHRDIELHYEP